MGSIPINFAEVEGGFDAIPEGRYPIVVEKVEVRESKSSDNHYLNWEMTVTDGEFEGRKLWMITSLSPKALFRLKDVFDALGVLEDDMDLQYDDDVQITPQSGPILLTPDVNGLPATAIVTIEYDYDPKGRNKVDQVVPLEDDGGGGGSNGRAPRPSGTTRNAPSGRRALR